MAKSLLPNFKKWTTDEKRLLVILLLVLIYPVFVSAFYALYLFVLMPSWVPVHVSFEGAHHEGWYHIYWLFVTLFWVILCTLILPFFKKEKNKDMDLATIERAPYEKRMHTEQVIKVEVKDEKISQSSLSKKSDNSIDNIKDDDSDVDVEKEESFQRSKESLDKSYSSLERKKVTQSGEFLNEFITTIQSEESVQSEAVCQVHAEEKGSDSEMTPKPAIKTTPEKYTKEASDTEEPLVKKESLAVKRSDTSSDDSSSDEDLETTKLTKCSHTSSPLKIHEATVEQQEAPEDIEATEEVGKLDGDEPKKRKKATPTIDTSRASQCYECSMPTPKLVESAGSQNNTVFLYVNTDTAATEDSILVSHGGEVEDSDMGESKV